MEKLSVGISIYNIEELAEVIQDVAIKPRKNIQCRGI